MQTRTALDTPRAIKISWADPLHRGATRREVLASPLPGHAVMVGDPTKPGGAPVHIEYDAVTDATQLNPSVMTFEKRALSMKDWLFSARSAAADGAVAAPLWQPLADAVSAAGLLETPSTATSYRRVWDVPRGTADVEIVRPDGTSAYWTFSTRDVPEALRGLFEAAQETVRALPPTRYAA